MENISRVRGRREFSCLPWMVSIGSIPGLGILGEQGHHQVHIRVLCRFRISCCRSHPPPSFRSGKPENLAVLDGFDQLGTGFVLRLGWLRSQTIPTRIFFTVEVSLHKPTASRQPERPLGLDQSHPAAQSRLFRCAIID